MTVQLQWSDVVRKVLEQYPPEYFGNIDNEVHAQLKNFVFEPKNGKYNPLVVEQLLWDVGNRLDRCVTYRREANELVIALVKAEMDYETYQKTRLIEDELLHLQVRQAQSELERDGFANAVSAFQAGTTAGEKLADGFKRQAEGFAKSSDVTADAEKRRGELIEERRRLIDELTDRLHLRLRGSGSAHNYADRWKRVVTLLRQDVAIAYEKALCAQSTLVNLLGIAGLTFLPAPWPAEQNETNGKIGFLDRFVLWTRAALDLLDAKTQREMSFDLVIPFVSQLTPLPGDAALFKREEFASILAKDRVFNFNLPKGPGTSILDKFVSLRLQGVGLSFSHRFTAENSDSEASYQIIERRNREAPKYLVGTAWIEPPKLQVADVPFYAPKIAVGRMLNFEGPGSPSMVPCFGSSPRGSWRIELGQSLVQSNDSKGDVDHVDWGVADTGRLWDIKLHLSLVGEPA